MNWIVNNYHDVAVEFLCVMFSNTPLVALLLLVFIVWMYYRHNIVVRHIYIESPFFRFWFANFYNYFAWLLNPLNSLINSQITYQFIERHAFSTFNYMRSRNRYMNTFINDHYVPWQSFFTQRRQNSLRTQQQIRSLSLFRRINPGRPRNLSHNVTKSKVFKYIGTPKALTTMWTEFKKFRKDNDDRNNNGQGPNGGLR